MAKHEAVDRLMALATEKRADRIPNGAPSVRSATEAGTEPRLSEPLGPQASIAEGSGEAEPMPQPSAAARGRQLLAAIRPLIPAVAGAMRLVDHGAVQAVARLLPLLGGPGQAAPQKDAPKPAPDQSQRAAAELLASHQTLRRDFDTVKLQVTTLEEQLGRTRTHVERLAAEQATRETELRSLSDRVRLLSAVSIILVMLVMVQMILLVVLLHK